MLIERVVVGALQTNAYLISDDNGIAAVVDPGGDAALIEDTVRERGLKLTKILLTHGHLDHLFVAGVLQQAHDLQLMMHQADVNQMSSNMDLASLFYDISTFVPPSVTQYVNDGDVVSIGDLELKVLHTPGHSPGGVCYVHNSVIFSGDTLFAGSVGRTDLAGGSYDDLVESIKTKLLPMKDNVLVYPGHGPETSIGTERQFNPYIG